MQPDSEARKGSKGLSLHAPPPLLSNLELRRQMQRMKWYAVRRARERQDPPTSSARAPMLEHLPPPLAQRPMQMATSVRERRRRQEAEATATTAGEAAAPTLAEVATAASPIPATAARTRQAEVVSLLTPCWGDCRLEGEEAPDIATMDAKLAMVELVVEWYTSMPRPSVGPRPSLLTGTLARQTFSSMVEAEEELGDQWHSSSIIHCQAPSQSR